MMAGLDESYPLLEQDSSKSYMTGGNEFKQTAPPPSAVASANITPKSWTPTHLQDPASPRCEQTFCIHVRNFLQECKEMTQGSDDKTGWFRNMFTGKSNNTCKCGGCTKRCCLMFLRSFYAEFKKKLYQVKSVPRKTCGDVTCRKFLKQFDKYSQLFEKINRNCFNCESFSEGSDESCKTCLSKFYEGCRDLSKIKRSLWKSMCLKIFFAGLVPIIAVVSDTVIDFMAWSQFSDQKYDGLVYGAVDQGKISGIFGLCITGVVLALFYCSLKVAEIVSFYCRKKNLILTRTGKQAGGNVCKHKDEEVQVKWECLEQFMVTVIYCFEDIPQDIIWVLIYACREKQKCPLFIVKIAMQLIFAVCRIVKQGITLFRTKRGFIQGWSCSLKVLRIFALFLMLVQFLVSSTLGYLNFYTWDSHNRLSPTKAEHFFDFPGFENRDLYLHDVSVFLNSGGQPAAWLRDEPSHEWMHLFNIEHIIENKQIAFKLKYETVKSRHVNMAVWTKYGTSETSWTLSGCYSISPFINKKQACLSYFIKNTVTYYMKFQFVCNKSYAIGQIFFNMKVEENGNILDWNSYVSARNILQPYSSMFHYFRHLPNDEKFLYKLPSNQTKFYNDDTNEILDAADIWRTGLSKCECKAILWPVLDPNIQDFP